MTDSLETARATIFARLTRCPVCGAQENYRTDDNGAPRIYFACTTSFIRGKGHVIEATDDCPSPTTVALAHLEAEAQALAATPAITPSQRALIDCYLSGQVSEAQWAQHCAEDPRLAAMVASIWKAREGGK